MGRVQPCRAPGSASCLGRGREWALGARAGSRQPQHCLPERCPQGPAGRPDTELLPRPRREGLHWKHGAAGRGRVPGRRRPKGEGCHRRRGGFRNDGRMGGAGGRAARDGSVLFRKQTDVMPGVQAPGVTLCCPRALPPLPTLSWAEAGEPAAVWHALSVVLKAFPQPAGGASSCCFFYRVELVAAERENVS